ncbi:unnamed protein product [Linum trigynum]|uniref:Uncharacterized protein n=1 Tax=Linum trigynum TaxID=586398 RepID=A0AAV2E9X7_9ROSI
MEELKLPEEEAAQMVWESKVEEDKRDLNFLFRQEMGDVGPVVEEVGVGALFSRLVDGEAGSERRGT